MAVILHTDGSRIGGSFPHEGGPGGLAYVSEKNGIVTEFSLGFYKTTNNRMEFLAVIMGLESFPRKEFVHVHTDSEYVIKSMTEWAYAWRSRRWIKKDRTPVKNVDLILRLQKLMEFHYVKFSWVKGHSGNELNERCDKLAKDAAKHPTETDAGFLLSLNR